MSNQWINRLLLGLGLLVPAFILTMIISSTLGSANIDVITVLRMLIYKIPYLGELLIIADWSDTTETIVYEIRVPRILLGGIVGGALGLAGASFQGLLRNPLADPYTVGVSSGAAVGAVFAFMIGGGVTYLQFGLVPFFAFIGAMTAITIVYQLAKIGGRVAVETLILAGVVVGSFLTALLSFMLTRAYNNLEQVVFWLMGSLALRSWDYIIFISPFIFFGMILLWLLSRELNVMALGEDTAHHLGVSVEKAKILVLFLASLITALAVSIAGTIGFVGLVVPHIVRMILGPDHRVLIPISALVGGLFLIWADTIARIIITPSELPVGVITALIGAPFFGYLLRVRKKSMSI
ncbi:Vitamin B12 ABC transporter, permease component BtuC [Candidatus Syntrophocurvum alkaliphilum]|uniref:Vitamin B12 ABC transporter, permease component BtuC n=1 Tax=Candidatus Syntrophocurvum alkaliphilum TaxID=2293317 RepID=A0A6I6D954_9FIRM|nr:iron chelate uptake ABC transporter family permease subunit [Candidatus Syntrophocurvum alkaliphilum]QGT99448.1 Vitamin B12 ABC transporter, permease component BtuC [Candidatus Syntrophocurvum alkaliphilum]